MLKKYIRSFYERKAHLDAKHENQQRMHRFLLSLNQYYQNGDRNTLKTVLSEVHHVLPLLPSFFFTAVCCALPLLSVQISKRVISNICRIDVEHHSLRAITIFLKRLSHTDQFTDIQRSLNELIFHGLDGTNQDQLKSIAVFQATVGGMDAADVLQDLIKVFDKVSLNCPTLDSIHPVIAGLEKCIPNEIIDPFLEHLCNILLVDPCKSSIVHSIDLILCIYHKHTATLLFVLYSLLLTINTKLSLFNADSRVHSRLLRLLTILLPLEDLEPPFRDSTQREMWVESRSKYEEYNHRISSMRMITRV